MVLKFHQVRVILSYQTMITQSQTTWRIRNAGHMELQFLEVRSAKRYGDIEKPVTRDGGHHMVG